MTHVQIPVGERAFLFSTKHGLALGPTQLPNQWVLDSFAGVKCPQCEVKCSLPSSDEVKNKWSYTSTPPLYLHGLEREKLHFCIHLKQTNTRMQDMQLKSYLLKWTPV